MKKNCPVCQEKVCELIKVPKMYFEIHAIQIPTEMCNECLRFLVISNSGKK